MPTLLITLFIFFAMPTLAQATSNADLYKDCKKYADNSFQIKDISGDLTCMIYFIAIRDVAAGICEKWGEEKDFSPDVQRTLGALRKHFGARPASGANQMQASIQHYVNEIAKKPEAWKFNPHKDVITSLQAIGGSCE